MTTLKAKQTRPAESDPPRLEFASVYRDNVGRMTAFFARRCRDPQQVADLTSQTFVEAIASAHTYRAEGPPVAWLLTIARRVYARHVAAQALDSELVNQVGGQLVLAEDEIEDLAERIDSQRDGRALLERTAGLSDREREAVELVDLMDLTPKDAAHVLGISPNALRVRLFRAHRHLRKDSDR